jgi:hypothetical protein
LILTLVERETADDKSHLKGSATEIGEVETSIYIYRSATTTTAISTLKSGTNHNATYRITCMRVNQSQTAPVPLAAVRDFVSACE